MKIAFKLLVYNFFVRAFVPYVTTDANKARYGISTTQATLLTGGLSDWTSKFDVNSTPLTHTPETESDLISSYQNVFPVTSSVRQQIKLDNSINLSALERLILNIPKPSPRKTKINTPTYGPSIVCIGLEPGNAHVVAINPKDVYKRAKPIGGEVIGVEMAITEMNAPVPNDKAYVRQEDETSTTFDMLFTSAQSGKRAYVRGFYINARGEASPNGIPAVFTIV